MTFLTTPPPSLQLLAWFTVVLYLCWFLLPLMVRLELLIKKKKNNIMSSPNASLGGDEWGQSYYSLELLRCGGKAADIQSSMTFGVCYFFCTFFNSWTRDLWFDKWLKLFFFSNGDNLNTPHRQTGLFLSLSLSFSVHLFLSVLLCFQLWSFYYPFSRDFSAICTTVDIICLSCWDLLYLLVI